MRINTNGASGNPGWLLALIIGFALAYLSAAELGHWLSIGPEPVATFWPPSGLYLAALLLSPVRYWPVLGLAGLLGNLASDVLLHDKTLSISLAFSAANALEAFSGAWLIQRLLDRPFQFNSLTAVLGLLTITALASTILGALIGAAVLTTAAGTPYWSAWQMWWVADLVGAWIVAPLVLALGSKERPQFRLYDYGALEGFFLLAGLATVALLLFKGGYTLLALPFFVLPLLLWAALRFTLSGAAVALILLALIAIRATVDGQGPFIDPDLSLAQSVILAQLFLGTCALCFLALAAVTEERGRALAALRTANDELERRVQERTTNLREVAEQRRRAMEAADRAAAELRKAHALLDALFAAAPIGIGFWDRDLRFVRVNDRLAEINGLPAAAHVGKTPLELFPGIANLEQVMADWRESLTSGKPLSGVEISGETPALPGKIRHWREDFFPVWVEGEIVGLGAVVEEITERKRAEAALRQREQEFRTLAENAPDIITRFDRQYRHQYINPAVERATGLPAEAFLGKTNRELGMPPESCTLWESKLEAVFSTGQELSFEFSFDGLAGKHYYHSRLVPEFNAGGTVESVLGVATDISVRLKVEQALHEARTAADAANQAKSEFLANMSHEIRTPMSAILGYADLLATHLQDPDNLQVINTIQRNGRHLLELINDILDLSKIEAGRLEITCERFAPDQLIADIRSLMAVRAHEKGLILTVEYPGQLPANIESDPRRLKQILINLLGNAIKFTRRGAVTLRVKLCEEGPSPRLQFEVIDTGMGIQPAQLEKLFQPFSQIDSSVTREHGGSGLGLAISQRLARLLDGEISVKSQWGQGSIFTCTVATGSLVGVARTVPRTDLTDTPASPAPTVRLTGRILVVDDRHDIRYLAQRYLEEAGAKVKVAADGETAIAAVAKAEKEGQPFTALVLDIQMPGLDGYTVARRLRAQGFSEPILALTAHTMKGDREKCLAAGCDEYLSKPIERCQLLAVLAQLIKARQPVTASVQPASALIPVNCRVLVVDDNKDAADSLSAMLRLLGHEAVTAYDGRGALAAARDCRPEVAILDLNLPGLDGYSVVSQMKAEPDLQQTVFIALSGQDNAAKRTREAGFNHHLLKPASIHELLALFPRRDANGLS